MNEKPHKEESVQNFLHYRQPSARNSFFTGFQTVDTSASAEDKSPIIIIGGRPPWHLVGPGANFVF